MTNSTVRMMFLNKCSLYIGLFLILCVIGAFCACDKTPEPTDTDFAEESVITAPVFPADTEPPTSAETAEETNPETVSPVESTVTEETTASVVELPKVEFD